MVDAYGGALAWGLRHGGIIMLVLLATVCLNVYLYIVIPKGFFPQQDTGRLIGGIQADQSISFQAMRQKLADFMKIVSSDPAVDNVVGFTGGSRRNSGTMFVALKPVAERKETVDQVIARLRGKLAKEPGANLFLQPVQDIRIGGRQSNAQWQYTLQADDLSDLRAWEAKIRAALSNLPELADVNATLLASYTGSKTLERVALASPRIGGDLRTQVFLRVVEGVLDQRRILARERGAQGSEVLLDGAGGGLVVHGEAPFASVNPSTKSRVLRQMSRHSARAARPGAVIR